MALSAGGVKRWFGGEWRARAALRQRAAEGLYAFAVAEARRPDWYERAQVPDTLDGRFDLILLHLFALMERLDRTPEPRKLQRMLSETFFRDMDRSLREIGASDTGLPRRVRAMADAYLGRMHAYRAARLAGPEAWQAALARNLYGTEALTAEGIEEAMALFGDLAKRLDALPEDAVLSGAVQATASTGSISA